MPKSLFYRTLVLILFTPDLIAATDFFPLSVGSRWHYRCFVPSALTTYHTHMIVSDTMIGRHRYFARQWSSSSGDTAIEWLYVSGTDVYKINDLTQPDSAVKIAQKKFTPGDRWIDGSGMVGNVPLVAFFKGRDSVPVGVYDSTWSAGGADTDTLAGGLIVIRNAITYVYAREVGVIRQTVVLLGTTISFLLDSFSIAPEEGIRNKQRLRIQPENKRVHCLTIMKSMDYIGKKTDRLYSLSGRLLNSVTINQTLLQRRLPSGMLIGIPRKDDRSNLQ
jgi:hypothetical protein